MPGLIQFCLQRYGPVPKYFLEYRARSDRLHRYGKWEGRYVFFNSKDKLFDNTAIKFAYKSPVAYMQHLFKRDYEL